MNTSQGLLGPQVSNGCTLLTSSCKAGIYLHSIQAKNFLSQGVIIGGTLVISQL